MALIELTLDKPAFKRTEVVGETEAEVDDAVETTTTETGGGRLKYVLLAAVVAAVLILAVRAVRS